MVDYDKQLEQENKIKLLEPLRNVKQHHKMQCLVCDHIWTATPISKRQTYKKHGVGGCPECNNARKNITYSTSRVVNLEKLKLRGIEVLTTSYDGRHTQEKIKVRNLTCGHEFVASAINLIQAEIECSVCGPQRRAAPLTAWSKANSAKWKETASEWQKYKAVVSSLTEHTYRTNKNKINPNNVPRGVAGQDGAYHLDHIVPKRFCFDNNIPPELCADASNLQMIGWRENVGSRHHIKGTIPPIFFQYISTNSKLEQYANTLKRIIPTSEPFVRIADIITTVYDSATNHAIVVIPLDSAHTNTKSALASHKAFTATNTQFTILFEDEMEDTALLTAKLRHYTNTNNVTRIHARQCTIKPCSREEKRVILESNHTQGNDSAMLSYGAYYQDKLVAVMTFSHPRVALGQKDRSKDISSMWELSRFCTDVKYRIPGIASKLLTHFKRHHTWTEIYSYADKRWSVGNMYTQLGFTLTADNPPAYFYVIGGQRKHRWNYRKDIIKNTLPNYDPTLTEYVNMTNHGFWRVWDCGTLRFSMKNHDGVQIQHCATCEE